MTDTETETPNSSVKEDVISIVRGRRSIRRFLPTPVPEETVRAILQAAARAPSGTNIQPWLVHVVTGKARERLSTVVLEEAQADQTSLEYDYLPSRMKEPYLSRRRTIGFALHEKYGIKRGDLEGRKAAMLRNFVFFGAPVGLFFTLDSDMAKGAWLDCGMFMQNVMVLARAHGLETCPQQAWCDFGGAVHAALGIPQGHVILSGMALGHADWSAPENSLVSEREPVDSFTTWHE